MGPMVFSVACATIPTASLLALKERVNATAFREFLVGMAIGSRQFVLPERLTNEHLFTYDLEENYHL